MARAMVPFDNPYKPSAGHKPPYLAGRETEKEEFARLLKQKAILANLVLTGLRGLGKTVLLDDEFKRIALAEGWLWVGHDMSESSSIDEGTLSMRIITDLAVVTGAFSFEVQTGVFLGKSVIENRDLNFNHLYEHCEQTPGLMADKLKAVLELVWESRPTKKPPPGIIFAYDEAQNLADHAAKDQYPLSMLLEVFQSIQRKGIPFLLVLTGLPTLFPKLVDARTYSERMFRVLTLERLTHTESRDAILKPIDDSKCPVRYAPSDVENIIEVSGGYPYFIQFICKELFDIVIRQRAEGKAMPVPMDAIIRKLDGDFFSGRWAKATDRQRQLLCIAAGLPNSDTEFTVQDIVEATKGSGFK